jgi:secreted Zn-dependent insulinase-like peptidase
MPGPYNASVTKAFLDRLRPDNCIVNIQNSDFDNDDEEGEHECSASSAPWQYEKWYRAKYREVKIGESLQEKWSTSKEIDSRLHLPAMNTFLPTDFVLRSKDPESQETFDPNLDYRNEMPKLLLDRPGVQMWHKMDRSFNVPKTSIRLLLTSPDVYRSPRSMTLMRIFVKVLEDDLNSYIYDASLAGVSARVSCLPSGVSISVNGYSEKLPQLLDVVTGRMLSIIEEMKVADESSGLFLKFDKGKKNLVRETKNFRLESPYETASYISRMLLEHNIFHVSNYIDEMEGEFAERNPVTLAECAKIAEECLTQRLGVSKYRYMQNNHQYVLAHKLPSLRLHSCVWVTSMKKELMKL